MSGRRITACPCADHMERSCFFAFSVLSHVSVSLSLSVSTDTEEALCAGWKPKAMWYELFVPKYLLSAAWGILDCPLIFFRALVSHERKVEEIDGTNITPLWSKTNIWTLTQTVDKHFHTLPAAPNFKYGQDTQRRFLCFPLCCSTRANADLYLKGFEVRMMCLVQEVRMTFGFPFWGVAGSSGEQTAGRRA